MRRAGHALLLDCRSLEYRAVALPPGLRLVVIETGAARRLAASEYNQRRSRVRARRGRTAATAASQSNALRDATLAMLDRAEPELGDVVYRRCRHVVDENARTLAVARALETSDRAALGRRSPPATPRCATCTKSARRPSTRRSTSPPRRPVWSRRA